MYTHKLVEGLLERGFKLTVLCEQHHSSLVHPALTIECFSNPPKGLAKWQRLQYQMQAATKKLIQCGSFDLVHSQHCPVVQADLVTFHNHTVARLFRVGYPWERVLNNLKCKTIPAYRIRYQYDELLCRRASCLIFPAKVMQEDYYETYSFLAGQKSKSYVVVYPGATLSHTESELGLINPFGARSNTKQSFSFLFVGRGYRKKGLDVLFAACRYLALMGKDFKLFIVGLKEKPLDAVRKTFYGLEGKIEYLGYQRNMAEVYAQAQSIVVPSRLEPFGMACLQAMHNGLVPIISKVSGICDIVRHQHDALILENHLDARELANLMTKLIDQPRLVAELSKNACLTAAQVTWAKTVEGTLEAYAIAWNLKGSARTVKLK